MHTGTSLVEALQLKKENRELFYEFYLYVVEKVEKEKKEIDKLKDRTAGGSGESDTFSFRDIPPDFVSEVEEIKEDG